MRLARIRALAAAAALLALPVVPAAAAPAGAPAGGPAGGPAPPEFVALSDVDPSILQEIRYHGPHNFTGRPVPGYAEPMCILTRPAAEALHAAQQRFLAGGYTLKVYDCYRPQRSVDSFVAWAKDLDDTAMKAEFYPNVAKSQLFEQGYIAEQSGHSRGSTVDLSLVELPPAPQREYVPGEPLTPCFAPADRRFPDNMIDMGTGYDCFDPLANADDPRIVGEQRANRDLLADTLGSLGFEGIASEWWHFTLTGEPFPETYFDFPVARESLDTS